MNVCYDAGFLIAADRNDRRVWADHRVRLEVGIVPVTTAPVVSQVSRSGCQVQLRRILRGCMVAAFASEEAHEVGQLLGRAGTSDAIDAHVVVTAARHDASVITSDVQDLTLLAGCLEQPVPVHEVGPRRRRS